MNELSRENIIKMITYIQISDYIWSVQSNPFTFPDSYINDILHEDSIDLVDYGYLIKTPSIDMNAFLCVYYKITANNTMYLIISVPGLGINSFRWPNTFAITWSASSRYGIDAFVSADLNRFLVDLHKYIRYLCVSKNILTELCLFGHSYGGCSAQVLGFLYAHIIKFHKGNSQGDLQVATELYDSIFSYYVIEEIRQAISVGPDAVPATQFSYMVLQDIYANGKNPNNDADVKASVINIDKIIFKSPPVAVNIFKKNILIKRNQ